MREFWVYCVQLLCLIILTGALYLKYRWDQVQDFDTSNNDCAVCLLVIGICVIMLILVTVLSMLESLHLI